MKNLFRHLRPYWASILVVVVLLFIQANADLSLPDYLSKIVNIGIQQGGLEPDLPEVIRVSTYEAFKQFLAMRGKTQEGALLDAAFRVVNPASPDAAGLVKKWPRVKEEPVMVLKHAKDDVAENARKIFLAEYPAFVIVSSLASGASSDLAMPPNLSGSVSDNPAQNPNRMTSLPSGAMSQAQILSRLENLDPLARSQLVVRGLKAEYLELGVDPVALQTSYIFRIGSIMLMWTLISVLATILVGFLGSRVAAGVARDLRHSVFTKVEDFSPAEFDTFSTASLITRTTNDVMQVQMMVIMGLRMLFYAPIIGFGGVIRAIGKASSMWWIIAAAVGVLIGIIGIVFAVVVPKFRAVQKLVDRLNLVVRENLAGMMVIRAFNRQDHEAERFDKANRDLVETMLYVTRLMVVLMPLMMLIMNAVSISIIWVGAHEVSNGTIRVGDMMAFMQYSMQIFFSFIMMSMMFIMFPRASVSADRIAEVIDTQTHIKNPPQPRILPKPVRGEIEFRDVAFRYKGAQEDVLRNISFVARPGTTTAIIGTTGAGKTTMISLIPRLYDVTAGSILFDGVDIRELQLSELRSAIGFVPQKSILFSGSVADNVRYGREEADEKEKLESRAAARMLDFVQESPEGLN
ncbi:MAG: ABC transporter ATP-binding protein, partial [Rectinema sp.]|nr:ABC transporter ATP-binding protein [Rectinema sp.]